MGRWSRFATCALPKSDRRFHGSVRREDMAVGRALTARRLIDGTGKEAITDAVILVEGERITAVGPRASTPIPEGATVTDLGDRTLLPGFIDAHTHITINPGLTGIIGQLEGLNEPSTRQVLRGARNLRLDLAAG